MYLDHFGLHEAPFRITPHTDFFFDGANRGATLEALLYAITHDEGIVKVSGEVGSGKTMLCRVLMERLPSHVETIHLANPSLSRDEILFTLAEELQINLATNRVSAVLRSLQEHLISLYAEGKQIVVLIDEAHAMPLETLEEIRLLSNLESNRHKLLQIVLFGQPELNDNLNRTEMRQLKERITHNFTLEPLVHADVAEYIDFRMRAAGYKGPNVFAPAALKQIAKSSLGLTRRINILCDKSLLAAFAGNTHQITASHVKAAVRDAEFRNPSLSAPGIWVGAGATILVLLVGILAFKPSDVLVPPSSPTLLTQPAFVPPPAQGQESGTPPLPASLPATPVPAQTPQMQGEKLPEALPPPPTAEQNQTLAATPVKAPSGLGTLTQRRIEETLEWLEATGDNRWFVQLLSTDAGGAHHIESFLANAMKLTSSAEFRVYSAEVNGSRRLGVIYGDFPTRQAASSALNRLPPALKSYGPFPRQVRRLRN